MVLLLFGSLLITSVDAGEFRITPSIDLDKALEGISAGDSIVLANGIWNDAKLHFESLPGTAEHPVQIRAQTPGKVILGGKTEFRISGHHITVSGLAFRNTTGASDVFAFRTHSKRHAYHSRITECVFEQTTGSRRDKESRWLNIYGTNNRIDHCYFVGKRNKGATLVVWVAKSVGVHQIDHNHFGQRPELGRNGGETIRIGTSDVSELNSRTIVEENYFEGCNGEGEVISNKSCENIYRQNVFDRCRGTLTLRHGHRCVVDGNVFLGRKESRTGGVRIIGGDHRVTNNYFESLRGDAERAAVCFMNGIPDSPLNGYAPVRNALVAHNTFIDCKVSMEFGVRASEKISVNPANCRISHNAYLPGKWELILVGAKPQKFTWLGNKCQAGGTRGANLVEIERVDILMSRASDGLMRPVMGTLESTGTTSVKFDIDRTRREGTPIAGCDAPGKARSSWPSPKSTGPTWHAR